MEIRAESFLFFFVGLLVHFPNFIVNERKLCHRTLRASWGAIYELMGSHSHYLVPLTPKISMHYPIDYLLHLH